MSSHKPSRLSPRSVHFPEFYKAAGCAEGAPVDAPLRPAAAQLATERARGKRLPDFVFRGGDTGAGEPADMIADPNFDVEVAIHKLCCLGLQALLSFIVDAPLRAAATWR